MKDLQNKNIAKFFKERVRRELHDEWDKVRVSISRSPLLSRVLTSFSAGAEQT
jgi:hypothetical protein